MRDALLHFLYLKAIFHACMGQFVIWANFYRLFARTYAQPAFTEQELGIICSTSKMPFYSSRKKMYWYVYVVQCVHR